MYRNYSVLSLVPQLQVSGLAQPNEKILPDAWMESYFRQQMKPFEGRTITSDLLGQVERLYPLLYHKHFARFAFRDGRVTSPTSVAKFPSYILDRFHIMMGVFTALAPSIPDLELEIYFGDGFTGWLRDCPAPVSSFRSGQNDSTRFQLMKSSMDGVTSLRTSSANSKTSSVYRCAPTRPTKALPR